MRLISSTPAGDGTLASAGGAAISDISLLMGTDTDSGQFSLASSTAVGSGNGVASAGTEYMPTSLA
jgi:hypothetical protein